MNDMTINEAFNNAIKNGWRPDIKEVVDNIGTTENYFIHRDLSIYEMCLDPLFWQALGKSMGWGEDAQLKYYGEDEDESMLGGVLWFPWEEKWHALIDHLASGKSIEDYFQSLS